MWRNSDRIKNMKAITSQEIKSEDRLVAELHKLGITYLSNRDVDFSGPPRSPAQMLASTIRQPGARVRNSVIAIFLLHPSYAAATPAALKLLEPFNERHRLALKLFYTAAVYLQREYSKELFPLLIEDWKWLPDLFSEELGIPPGLSPQDAIQHLGTRHQELTRSGINWTGTYKNVVHHLIRYKQRELQWNQLPPK